MIAFLYQFLSSKLTIRGRGLRGAVLQKALRAESGGPGSIPTLPVNVCINVAKSFFACLTQSLTPKMMRVNKMISKAQSNYTSSIVKRNSKSSN